MHLPVDATFVASDALRIATEDGTTTARVTGTIADDDPSARVRDVTTTATTGAVAARTATTTPRRSTRAPSTARP